MVGTLQLVMSLFAMSVPNLHPKPSWTCERVAAQNMGPQHHLF